MAISLHDISLKFPSYFLPFQQSVPMIANRLHLCVIIHIQELSDKVAPVQLTIEEVNDQAARLADSGVPLSHANLSRLEDLNSR